ncbi:hypothetical protein I5693_15870 [Burkholderia cenocepacia]|uniref:hypothetical protein n=1 Tax=Burkholderia TaxID=32008 RepID=UPI0006D3D11A|nr:MULTISPECIES: hypothetical protein [Burkholderia]MBJ9669026.1 hypothetical protein [Burkholderia cenocepacia]MBJ9732546.1 hypothetical protein [Burkholderia cenocepacia]
MTISNDEINFKDYAYKIDLATQGGLSVMRTIALKNGESVSLNVKVDSKENSDLKAINENSIRRAIEILQAFLPKEA